MAQPCCGSRATVLRMRRSSVPCGRSKWSVVDTVTLSLRQKHDTPSLVEGQGEGSSRQSARTALRSQLTLRGGPSRGCPDPITPSGGILTERLAAVLFKEAVLHGVASILCSPVSVFRRLFRMVDDGHGHPSERQMSDERSNRATGLWFAGVGRTGSRCIFGERTGPHSSSDVSGRRLAAAGTAVTLTAVGAVAGWLPAYRASRSDPAGVLRRVHGPAAPVRSRVQICSSILEDASLEGRPHPASSAHDCRRCRYSASSSLPRKCSTARSGSTPPS